MAETTSTTIPTGGGDGVAARAVGLRRFYGEGDAIVAALDGVTIDFRAGEFTAVMGPSGSGKSTLMHCMAALDIASGGDVFLGEQRLAGLDDKQLTLLRRDKIGFVFQAYNLVPTLTARENIELPLSIAGRKPDRDWFDTVIDAVGLGDRLQHRPNELSGGQQQRVACARALVSRPEIVFADEPTGNLDSASGAEVLGFLRRSVDDHGQTIVMVTHEPIAAGYTDRVVFLADGVVVDELRAPTAAGVLEKMKVLSQPAIVGTAAGGVSRMWRATWRNLIARKLRLAMSAFAIVLGVAFVAGSFIFTDAMGGAFSGIIKGTTADVEIAPKGASDFDSLQDRRTIPADLVDELEKLPEAESVHPYNQQQSVYVIDQDGDLVGGNGPPGLAFSYGDTVAITGDRILTLTDGDLPGGAGEVALERSTAEKAGYEIGDELELVTAGETPRITVTMTGLMTFGSQGGSAGATIVVFSSEAMQELFHDGRNVYSGISLTAADGVSQEELRDAATRLLPGGVRARTGDDAVQVNEAGIQEILGFINTFLLVFAGVSLVVGTFLIVNTFSILVAQRSRELALLRALGASKRQVNRSVLVEAFAVGTFGSTLGIGVGYLLALGLRALFGLFGLDLTDADFPVALRTVLVSYAVGLVVTMVAAYLPARRGSRIAPVAAMRDEVALSESSLRRRMIVGVVLVLGGVGLMVLGFAAEGEIGLALIGAGMLAILIGVALMAPVLGRPVIHGLGAAYRRLFGTVGVLATQNSLRNPRRTAATASALMIGLTLVALMSILGQSTSASTDKAIKAALTSEYIVSNVIGAPFSPRIAEQIRDLPEVETVAQLRSANAKVDGDTVFVGAVDPEDLAETFTLPTLGDVTSTLRPGTVLVEQQTALRAGLEKGDAVTMKLQGGKVELTLTGTFPPGSLPAEYLVTPDTLLKGGLEPLDSLLFITKASGAADGDLRAAVDKITRKIPTVTLKDPQEFADEQKAQINIFLYLVYALLGLAIVIAVLGIVNTLALSVIERTREVGLLRAVGMSRKQLRRMVRLESVAIAVLGAVLGVVMGVAFGVALQRAVADQGLDVLSIPWLQLMSFVALAGVVGVLAAVFPARRAARLNVLEAITTE